MDARRWAVVLVALPLAGCLEPPVSESLEIRILRGGASMISIGTVLRDPTDYDKAPRVQQRLESEARALESGSDAWSARLRAVDPERQQDIVDRDRGNLRRVRRRALLGTPADLREFFRDIGVGVTYADGKDWGELTLAPSRAMRATAAQRQKMDAELGTFSAKIAAYAAATSKLYDYLASHPDRARSCIGAIVDVKTEGDPPSGEEDGLIDAVSDAISAVGAVLDPAPGEPYTLDEISRLVYDPFPAPMRIAVTGEILEREGFPGELAAPLEVPVFSLWSAFERLEGRWFSPDPALALWRDDVAKSGKPFDLEAFLAIPRRAGVRPTASEVQGAIEGQLRPAAVYRVKWKPAEDEAKEPWD